MNTNIAQLEPREVWSYFKQLTQIPRPSKKEEKAAEFICNFGKSLGLETIKDEIGNVIIRKPATSGMENHAGVILQAHLDMVPQKSDSKAHNFETDPITACIDGDWVTADGTTLGADNGLGVAAIMAVLASKTLKHGPVEGLFTIDEETGMTGANNLKYGILKGKTFINLDSEDEGELYVGCAGGLDATFKFKYTDEPAPANGKTFKIAVSGMKGGHSGMDIILGRGNANKALFRILNTVVNEISLASVNGGSVRNAIPFEASTLIVVLPENVADVLAAIDATGKNILAELKHAEPEMKIEVTEAEPAATVINDAVKSRLVRAVYACPNGVVRMSDGMPGLVETSSNLAIVKSSKGETSIACLIRSSVDSAKADLADTLKAVFSLAGADSTFSGNYPGWNPNFESPILAKMKKLYKTMFGKSPKVKAIHAGLECGLLGAVYPEWDMISCGPTIRYPHSPDEKVNIASVEKWWTFLTATLENL
jgi:dipeptidase D